MKNIIIHCPTKELFTKVQEHEFAKGNCWYNGSRKVEDYWDIYNKNIWISLLEENSGEMTYGSKLYWEENYPDVKIISANEYLMEINTGDIFVDKDGDKSKVLAVIGDLVAFSDWGAFDVFSFWYTKSELRNLGWKKEGTEDSEVAEAIKVLEKAGKIKNGKILE